MNISEILEKHKLWLDGKEGGERADLSGADLRGADLRRADLRRADLCEANLTGAIIYWAYLERADLRAANLRGASLHGADLSGTNLEGADFTGAYLSQAILEGAILPEFQIPQNKDIVGWKKLGNNSICRVLIPEEAKRTATLISRKCRAEYVIVLEGTGLSWYDTRTEYAPAKVIRAHMYDDSITTDCSGGIHFFRTIEEAQAW